MSAMGLKPVERATIFKGGFSAVYVHKAYVCCNSGLRSFRPVVVIKKLAPLRGKPVFTGNSDNIPIEKLEPLFKKTIEQLYKSGQLRASGKTFTLYAGSDFFRKLILIGN
jgi:hypothetical protein